MNALTLTLSTLSMLAILSYARIASGRDEVRILSAIESHLEASHLLEEHYQHDLYHLKCITRKPKTASSEPKQQTTGSSEKRSWKPKRREVHIFPYKLNLAPVLQKGGDHLDLAQKLIERLYPHVDVATLFQRLRESDCERLARPEDLAYLDGGPVWTKLLQGDLLTYFTYHPDVKGRIYIAHAPRQLLEILFGDPEAVEAKTAELFEELMSGQEELNAAKATFKTKLGAFCEERIDPKYAKMVSYDPTYKPASISIRVDEAQVTLNRNRSTQPIL